VNEEPWSEWIITFRFGSANRSKDGRFWQCFIDMVEVPIDSTSDRLIILDNSDFQDSATAKSEL
jgi:hypothetical protein